MEKVLMSQMYLSLAPSTFVRGGLLDDVDVEVLDAKFEMFDYGGNADAVPALRLNIKELNSGTEEEVHYSVGALKDFEPSDDGLHIVPVGGSKFFRKGSNFAFFIDNLTANGFPEDKLVGEQPISILVGTVMHMIRKEAPKREGLRNQVQEDNGQKKTVLVPVQVIKLPWEGKGKQGAASKAGAGAGASKAGSGTGAGATTAAAAPTEDLSDELKLAIYEMVSELIEKGGGTVTKALIGTKAFTILKAPASLKSKAIAQARNDEFLEELGFSVSGDNVTVAS